MPITGTLTLDTAVDSRGDFGPGQVKRIERGFQVDGIDTTGLDPASLIPGLLTMSGMPAMGSAHPDTVNAGGLLLSNMVVVGILPDAVRGVLVYTTPGFATPSAYILTRSQRLVQHTEIVLPNGVVLQVSKKVTVHHPSTPEQEASGNPDGTDEEVTIKDYTPITVRRPVTQLVAEGIRVGSPDYDGADYVGYVNEETYKGRPAGSWLIEEFTTSYSKFQGYHNFRIVVSGNILGRYHSTFGILYNSTVGKHIEIDQDDVADTLANDDYRYGFINSSAANVPPTEGFAHIGPYPTVKFADIGLNL